MRTKVFLDIGKTSVTDDLLVVFVYSPDHKADAQVAYVNVVSEHRLDVSVYQRGARGGIEARIRKIFTRHGVRQDEAKEARK